MNQKLRTNWTKKPHPPPKKSKTSKGKHLKKVTEKEVLSEKPKDEDDDDDELPDVSM